MPPHQTSPPTPPYILSLFTLIPSWQTGGCATTFTHSWQSLAKRRVQVPQRSQWLCLHTSRAVVTLYQTADGPITLVREIQTPNSLGNTVASPKRVSPYRFMTFHTVDSNRCRGPQRHQRRAPVSALPVQMVLNQQYSNWPGKAQKLACRDLKPHCSVTPLHPAVRAGRGLRAGSGRGQQGRG